MPLSNTANSPQGTQSLARVILLLNTLALGRNNGLLLRDIIGLTDLTRPTTHRMLAFLVASGYVEYRKKTSRYVLGPQIEMLALSLRTELPIVGKSRLLLENVAQTIGDTVFLTIRTGNDTLCVSRRVGTYPIQVLSLDVGVRRPLGVAAAGISMLATLPDDEIEHVIEANSKALLHFGVSPVTLRQDVQEAKSLGYVIRWKGIVSGTRAVSVPVGPVGQPANVSLTIAATNNRITKSNLQEILLVLMDASKQMQDLF